MRDRLIAHLGHVEVLTPCPEESLRFYRDVLGLELSATRGRSAYLRAWGEWDHHSLVVTEAPQPGIGHIGWRMISPDHLDRAVRRLATSGTPGDWRAPSIGHGRSFSFRAPSGQRHELFYDVGRRVVPRELASPFPNRPQAYRPHGITPRQLDHVTVMSADPLADAGWHRDTLGFTFTEYTVDDDTDTAIFAMLTNTEKSHDLGLIVDPSGTPGRLHHISYWVDSRDELLRAADILVNTDAGIEFGPGRHGMGEQDYLYTREPGGVRIEINSGGYRLYEPDWKTVRWTPTQGSNDFYRNHTMPDTMLQATPPTSPSTGHATNPWSTTSTR